MKITHHNSIVLTSATFSLFDNEVTRPTSDGGRIGGGGT